MTSLPIWTWNKEIRTLITLTVQVLHCSFLFEKYFSENHIWWIWETQTCSSRRGKHISILTKLLDVLVQECGYPMQMQVASNMFVTIFTECFRYTMTTSSLNPFMLKLLSLLNLWELTLVQNNPYKEDFSNIHKKHSAMDANGRWRS